MGCPCEIGVYGTSARTVERSIEEAIDEVQRLDARYSHFSADSDITHLQVNARQATGTKVDTETAALLDYAARQHELSNGLFDVTAGSLSRLWHQRTTLPSADDIAAALQTTGWSKVSWQAPRLQLPVGVQLELGGIVKEYAADRTALVLKRRGMQSAFVELGGDIHVTGPRPDGEPWHMGVRNPAHLLDPGVAAIASVPINSGGMATSGDYERTSLIDGKTYSHIINPHTGWPMESFHSVSVLAPSCLLAGSISTLALLMGEQDGLNMLHKSGLVWLAQTRDGDIHSASLTDD